LAQDRYGFFYPQGTLTGQAISLLAQSFILGPKLAQLLLARSLMTFAWKSFFTLWGQFLRQV
jgi:hypothetical protein